MINTQVSPWLLLIPQLPATPAYLRVKVWRRLQAIGAAPLKNAVHALPNREDTRALFAELHRETTEHAIGRAAWRDRICQYVSISLVAESLNKTKHDTMTHQTQQTIIN